MLKDQWDTLIANYTSLETGQEYQLTLAAYDDACGAYNQLLFVIDSKSLLIAEMQQALDTLQQQLPTLSDNLEQLMSKDEPWVAQFLYRAYDMARSSILRSLYQQSAASAFMLGTVTTFSVQDTSYNGLLAKSADLQATLMKQLESSTPATPVTFPRITLNKRTVPGFEKGLAERQINFQVCVSSASYVRDWHG
jgi:hypothetical protein